MPDELIDIYDSENRPAGLTVMKSEANRKGLWHQGVIVVIYDDDGNVLLQRRSPEKDPYPNRWTVSASGHVRAGEAVSDAAIRETQEEIGITLEESELGNPLVWKHQKRYSESVIRALFLNIFFVRRNMNATNLILQETEVCDARWFPLEEFEQWTFIEPDAFVFYGKGYWDIIVSEIRKRLRNSSGHA